MNKIKKILALKNLILIFSLLNIVMYIPTFIFGFFCNRTLHELFAFEDNLSDKLSPIYDAFIDFNYQYFPWTILIIISFAFLMLCSIIKAYRKKTLKPSIIILYSCILILNLIGYYFQYRYNFEIWSF